MCGANLCLIDHWSAALAIPSCSVFDTLSGMVTMTSIVSNLTIVRSAFSLQYSADCHHTWYKFLLSLYYMFISLSHNGRVVNFKIALLYTLILNCLMAKDLL